MLEFQATIRIYPYQIIFKFYDPIPPELKDSSLYSVTSTIKSTLTDQAKYCYLDTRGWVLSDVNYVICTILSVDELPPQVFLDIMHNWETHNLSKLSQIYFSTGDPDMEN